MASCSTSCFTILGSQRPFISFSNSSFRSISEFPDLILVLAQRGHQQLILQPSPLQLLISTQNSSATVFALPLPWTTSTSMACIPALPSHLGTLFLFLRQDHGHVLLRPVVIFSRSRSTPNRSDTLQSFHVSDPCSSQHFRSLFETPLPQTRNVVLCSSHLSARLQNI